MMPPTSTYVNPFLKKGQQPSTDTAPVTDLPPGVTRPPTPPPSDNSLPPPSTAGRHVAFCKWWDRPKGFGFLGKEVDAPANDDDVYVQELDLLCPALNVGDVVEFTLGGTDQNTKKRKACDVKLIRSARPSQERQSSGRQRGTVKWFDPQKQYGFVAPDGGVQDKDDVFAHQYDVVDGGNALTQGERVEYDWAPFRTERPSKSAAHLSSGYGCYRDDHFQHLRRHRGRRVFVRREVLPGAGHVVRSSKNFRLRAFRVGPESAGRRLYSWERREGTESVGAGRSRRLQGAGPSGTAQGRGTRAGPVGRCRAAVPGRAASTNGAAAAEAT